MTLQQAIGRIIPPDQAAMEQAQKRLDNVIKPLNSLGKLERQLVQIAGITRSSDIQISPRAVVVFCADNGVVAQGVSQTSKETTAVVSIAMTTGETCVCQMAKIAGVDVIPVDIGVDADLAHVPGLLHRKVARGTRDFTKEPAMTRQQAMQAVETGIQVAEELHRQGYRLLATGEMGIGNTTTSAAVASVLLNRPVARVTGRGAGLSSVGLRHKIQVIEHAIGLHQPNPLDPLDILSKMGGLDIAGLTGLCIGSAACGIPVLLDGVIACAAAALACRICPHVGGYLLASHISAEPAGQPLLDELGLAAPIDAGFALGEGTGAVALIPLLDMTLEVYRNMARFEDKQLEPYQPMT